MKIYISTGKCQQTFWFAVTGPTDACIRYLFNCVESPMQNYDDSCTILEECGDDEDSTFNLVFCDEPSVEWCQYQ